MILYASHKMFFLLPILLITDSLAKKYGESLIKEPNANYKELTANNINANIYGSPVLWFVFFYRLSCGWCQPCFEPFKTFTKRAADWTHSLAVGGVECVGKNLKICTTQFPLEGTPTFKLFKPCASKGEKGKDFDMSSNFVEKALKGIEMLQKSNEYPTDAVNLLELTGDLDTKTISALMIVTIRVHKTKADVKLAQEVIMDFGHERRIYMRYKTVGPEDKREVDLHSKDNTFNYVLIIGKEDKSTDVTSNIKSNLQLDGGLQLHVTNHMKSVCDRRKEEL